MKELEGQRKLWDNSSTGKEFEMVWASDENRRGLCNTGL